MKKRTIKIIICVIVIVCIISILIYLFRIPKHVQLTITMQQEDSISREMLDNYADMTLDFEYYPRVASVHDDINVKGTLTFNGTVYGTYVRPSGIPSMNTTKKWRESIHWSKNNFTHMSFYDESYTYASILDYYTALFDFMPEGDAIFLIIIKSGSNNTEYWRTSFTSLDPAVRRALCDILHISESEIGCLLRERQATESVSG